MAHSDDEPRPSGGLFASLPRLVATVLEILRTRVEIVSTELEEERERLRELVIYGFWALFFTSIGIVLITLFVVMLLWQYFGPYVFGALGAIYVTLGLIATVRLRRLLRERPRLFAATLAELRKDRVELGADR